MSSSPVDWRQDGTPTSTHFGDIYRSAGKSGLEQARQVFLRGCGLLPDGDKAALWASAPRWSVLETGFGLGLNFLATWQAWRQDERRPALLFYSAVDALIPSVLDLLRSAAPFAELRPLAAELARQWHGLLPGVHRLCFDNERVRLTLAVGEVQAGLGQLSGLHDSLFLDGFNPAVNPAMWSLPTLQAASRLLRDGALAATWCVAHDVRERLQMCGFELERVPGLAPKRHALRACYRPLRSRTIRADANSAPTLEPGRCVVIGGGIAGAATAWSLAQRGWYVTVLDRARAPATGASGLPAGIVAPHVSPDDRPLSALTRAGARQTFQRAQHLLTAGQDFAVTGVLERHEPGKRRLPAAWRDHAASAATRAESLDSDDPMTITQAGIAGVAPDGDHPALWHRHAGWVRPAALVRAMLNVPGITWRGNADIAQLRKGPNTWQILDRAGALMESADLLVVAAGFGSLDLVGPPLPLRPLRGQLAYGLLPGAIDAKCLPPFPVNGHGSLIAHLPGPETSGWVSGSTFERENTTPDCTPEDHHVNRTRLRELLPSAADALDQQWAGGQASAWAGVRATLPDRLPAVGAWRSDPSGEIAPIAAAHSHLIPMHLCTGLGARGLTLAVLCGELLAAELHGEPLPIASSLAHHLRADRFVRAYPGRSDS